MAVGSMTVPETPMPLRWRRSDCPPSVWTGKALTGQEWLGGALIVAATLVEPVVRLLREPAVQEAPPA